ncbi:hypothetical protein F5X68DRAFT_209051 [Plectosphaerella plurivora]|uniref:Uncharacterized protein n=1 Tax=Plectosphaerella plurivora TaxID=936078 RepID=A0A9P9AC50_9PEZI|nr:hypothetical protein F5X68DRAFT_209051 [Plectosphaerella plurivora]
MHAGNRQRGLLTGGLGISRWASDNNQWSSRGHNTYIHIPRTSTSTINPVAALPPSTHDNSNWWENTPPPQIKGAKKPQAAAKPTPSPAGEDFSSSRRELRRYVQIVRRMKWKLPYLEDGYRRAIGTPNSTESAQWAREHPEQWENERQEAELHFKLDFFEYYMLLERALVHLLGVFGMVVSNQGGQWLGPGTNTANAGRNVHASNHSYHQNVLAALEKKGNPLFEALGSGEVRSHLFRAKDLRNRWKYAEASHAMDSPTDKRAPLESYDLVNMFNFIFKGFDQGYMVAESWVGQLATKADMILTDADAEAAPADAKDEEEMNFIFDAMDWEAV